MGKADEYKITVRNYDNVTLIDTIVSSEVFEVIMIACREKVSLYFSNVHGVYFAIDTDKVIVTGKKL